MASAIARSEPRRSHRLTMTAPTQVPSTRVTLAHGER